MKMIENEFFAYREIDEEGNGRGFSVVVSDIEKLDKAVRNVTDFKDGEEFLEVYDEEQGTLVYFELMNMGGVLEHVGWVEIEDGKYKQ